MGTQPITSFGMEYRERKIIDTVTSLTSLTKSTNGILISVPYAGGMNFSAGVLFAVFDASEINGKTLSYTRNLSNHINGDDCCKCSLLDGSYDRTSNSDFGIFGQYEITPKLNGLLQAFESSAGMTTGNSSKSFTISVPGGSNSKVTIMFEFATWSAISPSMDLTAIQVGDLIWDNISEVVIEHSEDSKDWGYAGTPVS